MSFDPVPSPRRAPDAERRERILEAAELAFAAHGFHAATMQHVAEAAGMSAGNLYRTFPSKEAIVEGLCLRDQQQQAADFAHLAEAETIDIFAAVAEGLKKHVAFPPRRKLTLFVEIWAEAARNPTIGAITRAMDEDALTKIEQAVAIAKACSEAAPTVEAPAIARLFFTYVGGLIKRLALEPDLDREAEAARAAELFKALCKGALSAAPEEATR